MEVGSSRSTLIRWSPGPDTRAGFRWVLGPAARSVAVTSADQGGAADPSADPLITVTELVDASLVDVTEGDVDTAGGAHARHYTELAVRLRALRESRHLAALRMAETELENFRGRRRLPPARGRSLGTRGPVAGAG